MEIELLSINGAGAIRILERFGFRLTLEGGKIKIAFRGEQKLPKHIVDVLIAALKSDKNSAAVFLKDRQANHKGWLAAYEAWEKDTDPANDKAHRQQLALMAVAGQLPFYEDGENDAGVDAWIRWANQAGK